jgi:dihydroorotase
MEKVVEGKTFINGGFQNCCIGIDEGKIVTVKKILNGDKHLRFKNKVILPAGVDIHVHFRDPGMTQKEDFYTGSKAAVFGGISCVCDMPNTKPQTVTVSDLKNKISTAKNKSIIDFGVYAGLNNNNFLDADNLASLCNGFKVYLGSSTNSLLFDSDNLKSLFEPFGGVKVPILFHAEDEKCLNKNKRREENISDHLESRPGVCEQLAVKKVLESKHGFDVKTHFCHISTKEAFNLIKTSNDKNVSCGVTPHHSLLNVDKKIAPQSFYKVNPPLRTTDVKDFLFSKIVAGDGFDVLESDHAPHTLEEKNDDFNEAPCGVPGVENMYPLFLYLAKKEKISWNRLFSLLCEKPSKIIDIRKGKIARGFDADLITVDLKDETKINSDMLHSRCGWTPFEGFKGLFPSDVFIRGERVIKDKELNVSKGFGKKV